MMRALYSGVSGLKTHQTKMDVIGNNITNVNTVAFKAGSVSFQEMMYQTTSNASGADGTRGTGGVNAKQIGLGVTNGAISNSITTQGAAQTTNDPFDLRIEGESFFVVSNGSEQLYTRAGAFYVDGVGNLAMKTTGYNVMGWACDEEGNYADDISPLKVMSAENLISNPEATTQATVSGILDKNGAKLNAENGGQTISIPFYDELGYSYTAKYNIVPVKDATTGLNKDGEYQIFLTNIVDSNGDTIGAANFLTKAEHNGTAQNTGFGSVAADTLVFGDPNVQANTADYSITVSIKTDTAGKSVKNYMVKSADGTEKNFTENDKDKVVAYYNSLTGENVKVADLNTLTADGQKIEDKYYVTGHNLTYNVADGSLASIGGNLKEVNMYLNNVKNNQALKTVTIDFSDSKNISNGGVATIEGANGDGDGNGAGKKVGTMTSLSVDGQGRINASYDNGNSRVLGKICVATFSNASGLEKQGENLYSASLNSGDASINEIAAKGEKMTSGNLEMSNVDLSNEFTDMITTQRGFQANSRIITTSDSLLEELVNLKR